MRTFDWENPMASIIDKLSAPAAIVGFALLLAWASIPSARAEKLSCSLLTDSLESNITLSLKTAETLLSDINAGAHPEGTLVGEIGRQFLTNYIGLANIVSDRISLVIDDLSAMDKIGVDCIEASHFKTAIGQARSANNINQYLHEKFAGASSETSVFLTVATARTLLGRAIGHKKKRPEFSRRRRLFPPIGCRRSVR